MLVLTRKNGQSIMLGDDVEITVLSNDGAKVRLGIQAPASVPIHRTEIYREIRRRAETAPAPSSPSAIYRARAAARRDPNVLLTRDEYAVYGRR